MKEYIDVYSKEYVNLLYDREYKIKIKIEFLDWNELAYGEIIQELDGTGQGNISISYQQGVRRTVTLKVFDSTGQMKADEYSPFWINKKFKLYLGIYNENEIYWWTQGVFLSNSVEYSEQTLTVNGYDKFSLFTSELDRLCLQETYVIPQGTKANKVIQDILLLPIGTGQPLDSIEPIIDLDFYNYAIPYEIKKEKGSYLGDVLIEIATSLNADIYYNIYGRLVVTKSNDKSYKNMQPLCHCSDENGRLLSFGFNRDLSKTKNKCTVYGYDALGGLHKYTAVNNNPISPTRISVVGENPMDIEENDMCFDDERCKDYANYKLKSNAIIEMSGDLKTPILPHIDVNNTIAITNKENNLDYDIFIIQSVNIPLSIQETSMNITNIKWLPDYEDDVFYNSNIIYSKPLIELSVFTTTENEEFVLPQLISQTDKDQNVSINWGDEQISTVNVKQVNTHIYETIGEYNISFNAIKYITDLAFKGCVNIKKLSIKRQGYFENAYMRIEPFAFYGITSLKNIEFSNEELYLYIGSYAFAECNNVTEIILPKDTMCIGQRAFKNCTNLKSVTFGKNTEYIGDMVFEGCSALESIYYQGSSVDWNNIDKSSDWYDGDLTVVCLE